MVGGTFYLAGPIDMRADGGRLWRRRAARALLAIGYGVVDPTQGENKDYVEYMRKLRKDGDLPTFYREAEAMMKKDLRSVEKCSAVLVHLPYLSHAAGTIAEIFHAWQIGKPVYIIHKVPFHMCNTWLAAMVMQGGPNPATRFFNDVKSFVKHIKKNGIV